MNKEQLNKIDIFEFYYNDKIKAILKINELLKRLHQPTINLKEVCPEELQAELDKINKYYQTSYEVIDVNIDDEGNVWERLVGGDVKTEYSIA